MRWTLGLMVMFGLNLSMAHANSCDCPGPGKDPLSHVRCGPLPAALNQEAASAENESCPSCYSSEPHWLNESVSKVSKVLNSNTEVAKRDKDLSIKSNQQLNTYLNCNREKSARDQERFCHFKETLSPLIELAARSAHQPFAVQACLFKKESEFNPNALSHAHAGGYIQFMPTRYAINKKTGKTHKIAGTMDDVDNILGETSDQMEANLEKLEHHIEDLKRKGQERSVIRNIAEHKGQMARYRAHLVWDKYWEGTPNAPKHLKDEDVHCQNTAFVASLMKQTVDLFLMTPLEGLTHPKDEMPKHGNLDKRELGVFLGGAYNTSPRRFAKKCGNANSLSECIGRISNHETHDHLIALDNCSKQGSWMSIARGDHSKQFELLKCEETSKCEL